SVPCAGPAGGRVPGPQAAPGLGGVPCLDPQPHRANDAGTVGDADGVAAVAVRPASAAGRRVVVAATVESAQDAAQCAGRRAAVAAAPAGNGASSGRVAGPPGEKPGARGPTHPAVTTGTAPG